MTGTERLTYLNHTTWNGVLQEQSTDCSARYSYTARHFCICVGGMSVALTGVTMSDLNQKILPCFKTNHLHIDDGDHIYTILKYSGCTQCMSNKALSNLLPGSKPLPAPPRLDVIT